MQTPNCIRLFLAASIILTLTCAQFSQAKQPDLNSDLLSIDQPSQWRVEFETAQLFGIENRNSYQLAPQLLTLQFRPWPGRGWASGFEFGGGLLLQPVVSGPESFYFAGMLTIGYSQPIAQTPLEWFVSFRGGAGRVDSTNVRDALGQDFTFALQAAGGLQWRVCPSFAIGVAFLYQHLSNAGLSEPARPNVGLDAMGPAIRASWNF